MRCDRRLRSTARLKRLGVLTLPQKRLQLDEADSVRLARPSVGVLRRRARRPGVRRAVRRHVRLPAGQLRVRRGRRLRSGVRLCGAAGRIARRPDHPPAREHRRTGPRADPDADQRRRDLEPRRTARPAGRGVQHDGHAGRLPLRLPGSRLRHGGRPHPWALRRPLLPAGGRHPRSDRPDGRPGVEHAARRSSSAHRTSRSAWFRRSPSPDAVDYQRQRARSLLAGEHEPPSTMPEHAAPR